MSYTPPGAVRFNGNTILKCAALACADNGKFSMFVGYHALRAQYQNTFFVVDRPATYNNYAGVYYGNAPFFNLQDSSKFIYSQSNGGPIDLEWHTLLISADGATGEFKMYRDDVEVDDDTNVAGGAFTALFNGKPFWIGGDGFSSDYIIGDLCIFWAFPGLSLISGGAIPSLTRRMFTGSDNSLKDPAGFPGGTPPVLLNGPAATFADNLGDGGTFSVDGDPLTDAPSLPGATVVKTIVVASGSTVELPPDFTPDNNLIHAIGGGMPGIGGSEGGGKFFAELGVGNVWPSPSGGKAAGTGGMYVCQYNWPGLLPGQVLDISVAVEADSQTSADWWAADEPYNLSTPTWIKDTDDAYILYALGGDTYDDSQVGEFYCEGGDPGYNYVANPAAGGVAGSPLGVYWGQMSTGGVGSAFAGTDQYVLEGLQSFGPGGASGQIVPPFQDDTDPRSATRALAGPGTDNGQPAGGGNGGDLTTGAGSSLLLPTVTPPYNQDWVTWNGALPNFGTGDFTVEFFYAPSFSDSGMPFVGPAGTRISSWDRPVNQASWFFGAWNTYWRWCSTTDGTVGTNNAYDWQFDGSYLDGLYPSLSGNLGILSFGFNHHAICRESGNLRFFLNGVPMPISGDPTTYAQADLFPTYFVGSAPLTFGGTLWNGVLAQESDDPGFGLGPATGWYGNARITVGSALYTCAATSMTPLGQQFTPPATPVTGGFFSTNWPGDKGDTSTTASSGTLTFHGNAQIDTDNYCFVDSPGIGSDGEDGFDGDLWVDSNTEEVAGPGGGPGGGAGSMGRYKITAAGNGGDGGKYGAGGAGGGPIDMAEWLLLGDDDYTPSLGGKGAPGVIVIQYEGLSEEAPEVMIGGTNFMLDCDELELKIKRVFLAHTHTNSELEIGPFRFPEQKHADETSAIESLIIGLSESLAGTPVVYYDFMISDEDDFDEDWGDSELSEDTTDDWGRIPGFPDYFALELMATDDGMIPQFQGVERVVLVEELNSARQYKPQGYSAIMHRLKLKTEVVGDKFYFKYADIAGLLAGRHK